MLRTSAAGLTEEAERASGKSAKCGTGASDIVERVVNRAMLKPLGNRVLVKPLEQDDTTAGGIVLPDSAKKRPQEAEIVAVGDGERLEGGEMIPIPLKVGDIIIYPEFSGTEIRIDEEDHLILEVDSVLAIKKAAKKKTRKRKS